MTYILAVDPGPTQSAFVVYDIQQDRPTRAFGKLPNERLLDEIAVSSTAVAVVIEKIVSYGKPVGEETFETVFWSGRFADRAIAKGLHVDRIERFEVKKAVCRNGHAKDPHVRQALIDRFGGSSALARSKKCSRKRHDNCPKCDGSGRIGKDGILVGFSEDVWAALGVACAYHDTRCGLPF